MVNRRSPVSAMRLDPQLAHPPLAAPSRSLGWRYALTLGTVAALSIGGQVVVHGALAAEAGRAHVVNLAGRQRLLGERLGKQALGDPQALSATLAELTAAHAELQTIDGLLGPELEPTLAALTTAVAAVQARPTTTTTTTTSATTPDPTVAALLTLQERWVATMDAALARHELASAAHVARLRRAEQALLVLVLLTLALEGLLVVRPALRRLQRATEAALAGARQRAALLAALPEPVVLLGRDGALQDSLVPPAAHPGALEHLAGFLHGPHAPVALAALRAVDDSHARTLDIGPGASDRRFELRLSAYQGDTVLALLHDVTDQRRLERRMLDEVARAQQQMGSDLHDGVCQQLTGLLLLAQALEGAARRGQPTALADLSRLREHLAASAVEVRQVSQSLYPVVLAQHGLVDALRQLCSSVSALHGIPCTCITALDHLSLAGAAIHLYRIAQEAVANAVRHAHCTAIEVLLHRTASALVLEVRDDGTGLPTAPAPRSPGMGLHSMSHRADAIGAFLTISPRDNGDTGGTVVRVALPDLPASRPA